MNDDIELRRIAFKHALPVFHVWATVPTVSDQDIAWYILLGYRVNEVKPNYFRITFHGVFMDYWSNAVICWKHVYLVEQKISVAQLKTQYAQAARQS